MKTVESTVASADQLPPVESRRCWQCGARIQGEANFCHVCGASIPAISQWLGQGASAPSTKNRKPVAFIIGLVFVIGLSYLVSHLGTETKPSPTAPTVVSRPTGPETKPTETKAEYEGRVVADQQARGALPQAMPTVTDTSTKAVAAIPKAVSLDQVIDNAKSKITSQSTSGELKTVKAELLKIRRSSRRYPEVQQMLRRIDEYIEVATKTERRTTSKWEYSEGSDEMGRGTNKFAYVASLNTVSLRAPYEGEQHVWLKLQKNAERGLEDVVIKVERGQFVPSWDHKVIAKFDDGKLQEFGFHDPAAGMTGYIIIIDPHRFINQLSKAQRLKIEVEFWGEGARVIEFDVHELNW